MGSLHDLTSQSLAVASVLRPAAARSIDQAASDSESPSFAGKDVLSDVLRAVKLTGALFFRVNASSPWSVDVPRASTFADVILPRAQHVISYHIIIKGSGWIEISDSEPMEFVEGDILVIAHGDRYAMRSAPLGHEDSLEFFRAMAAGHLPSWSQRVGEAPVLRSMSAAFWAARRTRSIRSLGRCPA